MTSAGVFFDLEGHPYSELFAGTDHVWEALPRLKSFIAANLQANAGDVRGGQDLVSETTVLHEGSIYRSGFNIDRGGKTPLVKMGDRVLEGATIIFGGSYLLDDCIHLGKSVVIEPTALVKGPAIIGDGTEVRHGAYIRGDVLIGADCVVGHATEIKASVMLGNSKAGHFAYIGDSILGRVNLGAGTRLANLKMIEGPVVVTVDGYPHKTGLRKFGAILGDGVETGCNSVTNPGTLLGREVLVYPNATARGYYPSRSIVKVTRQQVVTRMNDGMR